MKTMLAAVATIGVSTVKARSKCRIVPRLGTSHYDGRIVWVGRQIVAWGIDRRKEEYESQEAACCKEHFGLTAIVTLKIK